MKYGSVRRKMETLAEALSKEQKRARKLLIQYKEIGVAGQFGAMMIEQSLHRADAAVMSGDVSEMLKAYEDLKGLE